MRLLTSITFTFAYNRFLLFAFLFRFHRITCYASSMCVASEHARRVDYDTHDLRLSERERAVFFFLALSRRQRWSSVDKDDDRKFRAERDADVFTESSRKNWPVRNNAHTRAVTPAQQYAGNWSWRGWLMDLPGMDLCRQNAATFIPSNEQSKRITFSAYTYDLRFRESLFDAWDEKCVLVSLLSSLPVEIY